MKGFIIFLFICKGIKLLLYLFFNSFKMILERGLIINYLNI